MPELSKINGAGNAGSCIPFRLDWEYDEDHHIQQYSSENEVLPTHVDFDCNCKRIESDGPVELHQGYTENDCFNAECMKKLSPLGKAWETPPLSAIQRREKFRSRINDETICHRRIILKDLDHGESAKDEHGNINVSTELTNENFANQTPLTTAPKKQRIMDTPEHPKQNVVDLLRDREVYGSRNGRSVIRTSLRRNRSLSGMWDSRTDLLDESETFVFDIKKSLSTAKSSNEEYTDDVETRKTKRRRRKLRRRYQPNFRAVSKSPTTVTASAEPLLDEKKYWNLQRKHPIYSSSCYRTTTQELRTFAEQMCVTKFESSYLSHLQKGSAEEEEQEGDGNQGDQSQLSRRDNPQETTSTAASTAVSTISIAFSPDGKTMASTHGDHTVKITCCLTGTLLQTLVGHPRTPWTVKFHPQAGDQPLSKSNASYQIIADSTSGATPSSNIPVGTNTRTGPTTSSEIGNVRHSPLSRHQKILASGCLGHQVRIWDWVSGTCLQMIRLDFAIISLSFHPSGDLLAIANGSRLHFWGLPTMTTNDDKERESNEEKNENADQLSATANSGSFNQNHRRGGTETSMEMRHMLRCVHFLPDGKRVIVGGVNPQSRHEVQRQRRAADLGQRYTPPLSFYLRLWDFDLEAAKGLVVTPIASNSQDNLTGGSIAPTREGGVNTASATSNSTGQNLPQQQSIMASTRVTSEGSATTRRKRPITNGRPFVPRALLYNDGGFDVSPDGKTLCACAEYWLPEEVENATDLLHLPQDDEFGSDEEDSESFSDGSSSDECSTGKNDIEMDGKNVEGRHNAQMEGGTSAGTPANKNDLPGKPQKSDQMVDKVTLNDCDPNCSGDSSSPTRQLPSSSYIMSRTPPRIVGRHQQQISSPPPISGVVGSSAISGSVSGIPTTPIHQGGRTPQTPPPNVNPLNYPLSPPSPPGRRFAGGLIRASANNAQSSSQQSWQEGRPRAPVEESQQQQSARSSQQQRSLGTNRRWNENTASIPAAPGITHRNQRQHRLDVTARQTINTIKSSGNPFATAPRNARGMAKQKGRFVPHVVTISLDTEPYIETTTVEVPASPSGDITTMTQQQRYGATATTTVTKTTYHVPGRGGFLLPTRPHTINRRPRLGQLLSACPLDSAKASAVTCVKFSPCTEFCLIGYGVREQHVDSNTNEASVHPSYHPVTAMYKVNKGGRMRHISTMLSGDDDVNIARFHPESGYGFVYGTKQGRIRVLGPRAWNYYNC